ncbi:chaplin [Streptomyces sp. HMX87]|uniref:chaplin n=1 Tax=Streptomyces sp. HMX87 TaxID=3390849 RepID=UPI003A8563DB
MRRVTRFRVLAVAASGAMAVTVPGSAFASDGAAAEGSAAGSPGVVSGNTVQLPVHVPVNACGNTVNVAGLLNPAAGNGCANTGGHRRPGHEDAGPGTSSGGAAAESGAKDSPGVVSGNGVQLPVELPVNISGNSVNVVGIGNPATGNESENGPGEPPTRPQRPDRPAEPDPEPSEPPVDRAETKPAPQAAVPPRAATSLAETGTDGVLSALAGSTALVLGGAALYRRFRPGTDA